MDSNVLDDILKFTKDELLAEVERRGMTVAHEKTKMEISARILEDNSRRALEQSPTPVGDEVSTADLLRIVHQMLAQSKNSGKLISTPDLSHTLPTFAGRDEDTLKEWISAVEAMRLQYEWEDATVLAIAQSKLRNAAKDWNEGAGRKIKKWEDWKAELNKQFGYEVTVLTWSDRCKTRVQREEENIADYMHSKMKMIEKCPVQLRERDKVDYLVVGIREKSVASGLLAHFKATNCDCYSLIELARDLEPRIGGKGQEKGLKLTEECETKAQDRKIADTEKADWTIRGESDKKIMRCFRCNELGHFGRDHDDPSKAKRLPPVTKNHPGKREYNFADRDNLKGSKAVCAVLYKEEFCSKHPTRPVVPIRVNDHTVDGLLDSGADITVIRSNEAEDMGLLVKPWNKPNVNVVGADSHPKGVTKIMVGIGKKSAVVEAVVVDRTPYPVLVGSDWKIATNTGIMAGPGRRVLIEEGEDNHEDGALFLSLFLLEEGDKSPDDSGWLREQTEIQTEKASHEESLSSLRNQMLLEMEEERQRLGSQVRDLRDQHAKELDHEMESFHAEIEKLRSRHEKEMEVMKLKMEGEVQHSLLESQKLEETKLHTQEEFLKKLEDLKVNLNKEHAQLREETASQMKIQHEKDLEEMVQKKQQDFSAGKGKILKQQHKNELKKYESDLEKQLAAQKLSLQRNHEEKMAALEKEYEERHQETRNRIQTDSWVRRQNEEMNSSKEDRELSGQQLQALIQKMDILDRRIGHLETNKSDTKIVDRDDDGNRTAGTYTKNLQKVASFIISSKQGPTKLSLFFLMFGYEPRLEGEVRFGTVVNDIFRLKQIEMLYEVRIETKRQPKTILSNEICELEGVDGSEVRRAHTIQPRKFFEKRNREDGTNEIEALESLEENNDNNETYRHELGERNLRKSSTIEEVDEEMRIGEEKFKTRSGREVKKPTWQNDFVIETDDEDDTYSS